MRQKKMPSLNTEISPRQRLLNTIAYLQPLVHAMRTIGLHILADKITFAIEVIKSVEKDLENG